MEPETDAAILARSVGAPELFGLVFDRHFATVHRYLERRVGRDGADELAGDVFRIAFEQRGRFRPLHESALPWLYGFATNLVLKHWRREGRRLRALARLAAERPLADPFERVDELLAAGAARARLYRALERLPAGDRDALLLVAWEELSYEEVAVALEIPVGTVRSRINRARRRLRELLGETGDEQDDACQLRAAGSEP